MDGANIDWGNIRDTTETHIEDYITTRLDITDPIRSTFREIDITVEEMGESASRKHRSLQETEATAATAKIGGSITLYEIDGGGSDADTVENFLVNNFQQEAFADEFLSGLKSAIGNDATAIVSITSEVPIGENVEEPERKGSRKTTDAVTGVLSSFAIAGVVVFAYIQYKKRKLGNMYKPAAPFEAPKVLVETEKGEDGDENFEAVISPTLTAVMSPTFSIQGSAKSESNGFTMPQGSRVKNFTSKKSDMSVAGDYDDAYSLDGSTALGHNPNPGDKMLGQVLAMSSYTPASDVTCLNGDGSPGKPNIIRVASKMHPALGDEESVFTYSNDYSCFDSPSVLGEMSVSGNSMMSERFNAHGRSLTIGGRKSLKGMHTAPGGDKPGDESSTDGIEVAIDRHSEADSESVFSGIDPKATKKPPTPTKTLNFNLRSKDEFKVNVVETEYAHEEKPTATEPVLLKKAFRPWSNRQVQRVEEHHKVTITTAPSTQTLVKTHYPTQAAQRALADDSSNDGDSYSSYFSTDNEEDDISKLLRDAKKDDSRKGNTRVKQKPQNKGSSNSVIFPIRASLPLQQQRAGPIAPSSAQGWRSSSTLSPTKKRELNDTIKSKGISTTNYAAEARRNRMARRTTNADSLEQSEETNKDSISNQVASLRRARLQQRTRM